jgi:cytochrome c biogenesis protein CcdA
MTAEVLLPVGGLAVLDTLSPTTIGITLYLLLTAQRLARLLFTYLATVALSYFALGAVLMLGLGAVVNVVDERVALVGQAVVGAGLLVGSWFIPDRKPGAAPPTPKAHTAAAMVLLGVTTWVLEAATALPYFGAVGIMTAAGLTAAQWLPVLAGYTVVMVLPSVALYAAWRVAGPRLQPRLERWRNKKRSNSRNTLRWIVGIAGFLVLWDALARLTPPGSPIDIT